MVPLGNVILVGIGLPSMREKLSSFRKKAPTSPKKLLAIIEYTLSPSPFQDADRVPRGAEVSYGDQNEADGCGYISIKGTPLRYFPGSIIVSNGSRLSQKAPP